MLRDHLRSPSIPDDPWCWYIYLTGSFVGFLPRFLYTSTMDHLGILQVSQENSAGILGPGTRDPGCHRGSLSAHQPGAARASSGTFGGGRRGGTTREDGGVSRGNHGDPGIFGIFSAWGMCGICLWYEWDVDICRIEMVWLGVYVGYI